MAERNVLIVAYYFPPLGLSGVQRVLKFVKYLPDFGWNPIVLTASPGAYYAYDDTLTAETEGVEIHRTDADISKYAKPGKDKKLEFPSYFWQRRKQYFLQWFLQPDSRRAWKKSAVKLGSEIIEKNKIDLIFASAPPFTSFMAARELSKKYNIPYYMDYRDVWIDNPFHIFPTIFHKNYNIKLESELCRHASGISVTSRNTKELMVRRHALLTYNDITIISHGFDPKDFEEHKEVKPDGQKFLITHSGVFQDNRTPKHFFRALSSFLKKNKDAADNFEARFVGLMRKSHLKIIKKLGLQKNVNVTGYLNHSDTIKNLMQSDALWLYLNDTVRTPGKLYEYFGARKPILICAPDGEMKKTTLDSKAAIATNPKDEKAIEQALDKFYRQWKNKQLEKPPENFINKYDRKELTELLARELSLAAKF